MFSFVLLISTVIVVVVEVVAIVEVFAVTFVKPILTNNFYRKLSIN